jgi:hypothetical protein
MAKNVAPVEEEKVNKHEGETAEEKTARKAKKAAKAAKAAK